MSFLIGTLAALTLFSYNEPQKNNHIKHCIHPENINEMHSDKVRQVYVLFSNGRAGSGTGVVISEDGKVITSTHVIDKAAKIGVRYGDSIIEYEVFKKGSIDSITILKAKNEDSLKSIDLSKEIIKQRKDVNVGERIYSIGFPLSQEKHFSSGHIAGKIENEKGKFIFVDMAIYQGMSGSPVFDCEGSFVGYVYGYKTKGHTLGIINPQSDANKLIGLNDD